MKTSKLTAVIFMIATLLVGFSACKKDKNNSGSAAGGSYYQFGGNKYNISTAAEKHIDGDIFLEFDSGNGGDYLQINLPESASLPIGVLTYNADRFSQSYDPLTNFWVSGVGIGGVNTAATGGTVTIAKTDGGYKITFNITTGNGNITGEYTGTPTKI